MSVRTKTLRLILPLLALCLALTACGGELAPLEEGDPYRDFTAELADGSSIRLSDHEGKAILLNFWATWCGPCVGELPAFPRLIETFGDDLALLAVNIGESKEDVQAFLSENNYTFPVAFDPESEIAALYPTDSIPCTVIIAPDGTVKLISIGAADADTMYEYYCDEIERVLK